MVIPGPDFSGSSLDYEWYGSEGSHFCSYRGIVRYAGKGEGPRKPQPWALALAPTVRFGDDHRPYHTAMVIVCSSKWEVEMQPSSGC
jgi:hypothetical protein